MELVERYGKQILRVSLILLSLHIVVVIAFYILIPPANPLYKQDKEFKAYKNKFEYLVLGNHLSMKAFSEVGFDGFNYSSERESLMQNYYKLKYILEKTDKKFKKLIVPVDYHLFTDNYDDFEDEYYWSGYVNYFELGSLKADRVKYLRKYLATLCVPYGDALRSLFGKAFGLNDKHPKIRKESSKILYMSVDMHSSKFRELPVYYLKKIIDLAKDHKLEVRLLRTPVSKEHYLEQSKYIDYEEFDKFLSLFMQSYPELEINDSQSFF